jgi:hypothetical protein
VVSGAFTNRLGKLRNRRGRLVWVALRTDQPARDQVLLMNGPKSSQRLGPASAKVSESPATFQVKRTGRSCPRTRPGPRTGCGVSSRCRLGSREPLAGDTRPAVRLVGEPRWFPQPRRPRGPRPANARSRQCRSELRHRPASQVSWENMSLPLAVVSGTCWRTSQCSMILPSSLNLQMSTPAMLNVL